MPATRSTQLRRHPVSVQVEMMSVPPVARAPHDETYSLGTLPVDQRPVLIGEAFNSREEYQPTPEFYAPSSAEGTIDLASESSNTSLLEVYVDSQKVDSDPLHDSYAQTQVASATSTTFTSDPSMRWFDVPQQPEFDQSRDKGTFF
eukprot:TRINITY_DN2005_c0_g1_i2.p1 TRINITY_DN2005_c0_g1~~TRINITY_DN2005_c0_g1_i2.p1  ORF type:complete len:146 (+),score=23.24 TRINITY_DN2005_c0_g1_i2:204-641(+)